MYKLLMFYLVQKIHHTSQENKWSINPDVEKDSFDLTVCSE